MIKTLTAGAIGVKIGSLEEGIRKSAEFGFDGYEFDVRIVAEQIALTGSESVAELFETHSVVPAAFGLPVDWRNSEETWREGLEKLEGLAAAAKSIGCSRTATWIMPCSNDRPFDQNWEFHVNRFRPIAKILDDFGISLGLEFIGPKTLRDTQTHPFVHDMASMLDLGREIGPNVGLLLDAYHWHTSHGTVEQLKGLSPKQVVYVHVNDAIAGVPVDELMDGTRRLPGETGVIDLQGFVQALREIGFDGPVAVEPFKKELQDLPSDDERLRVVSESLRSILG